jgi:hypothetical protein
MLRGQIGRQWRGTYDVHFNHSTLKGLENSWLMGCCICRIIWDEITEKEHGEKFGRWLQKHLRAASSDLDSRHSESSQIKLVRAFLSEVENRQGLYRLDFRLLDYSGSKRVATFLLEHTSESVLSMLRRNVFF